MQINDQLLDIEGIKKSKAPLLDLFIRRTAVLTSTPEHLVEKIIKDQWANANKSTQMGKDIAEIDFCNLGTFYVSKHKAKKRLEKTEKTMNDLIGRLKSEAMDDKTAAKALAQVQRYKELMNSIKQKTKINIQDEH